MKRLWQELVVDNPMLAEIGRFKRRFSSGGSANPMYRTLLIVSAIAYLCFLAVMATYAREFEPWAIIMFQTAAITLFIPLIGHGMISGERDRRSWDLLMAAPLSKAQVVAGKLIGSLGGLALIVAAFTPPTIIAAIGSRWGLRGQDLELSVPVAILGMEALSIGYGIFTCALTLLISSRCKRSHASLGACLTAQGLLLIGIPILGIMLIEGLFEHSVRRGLEPIGALHPFVGQTYLIDSQISYSPGFIQAAFIAPFVYLAVSALMVLSATRGLNHADAERPLLAKRHA